MTTLGGTRPRTDSLAWLEERNCRGADPDIFFPGKGQRATEAKAICNGCPVTAECLADAMAERVSDDHGVRGGLTREERKTIRRNRRNRTA